jgi:hypothetical protein
MIRNTASVFRLPSGAGHSEVPERLDSVEEQERVVERERAEAQQQARAEAQQEARPQAQQQARAEAQQQARAEHLQKVSREESPFSQPATQKRLRDEAYVFGSTRYSDRSLHHATFGTCKWCIHTYLNSGVLEDGLNVLRDVE